MALPIMDKWGLLTIFSILLIAMAIAIIWWRRTRELKIGMEVKRGYFAGCYEDWLL